MSVLATLPVWLQWVVLWVAAVIIALWWWYDAAHWEDDDDAYPQVRDERGYGDWTSR